MGNIIGGDLLDLGVKLQVTAGANLAAKTFVNLAGTVPSSAAVCTGGIVDKDTPSGEVADVKMAPAVLEVVATGTVTLGAQVEILTGTIVCNISGTQTNVTGAGVQDLASGYPVGRALTAGSAGDTVLVQLHTNQAKTA